MKTLPFLAFLVTAAIGWNLAGHSTAPAKSAGSAATAPGREQRPERRARKTAGPSGAAGEQLAHIRASRDPSARMRATVDLASTLSPAEFAAWMDGGWFNIRGGAELTLFTKIIQQRWKDEDPEGLVAWAMKNKSGQADSILNGWAATDPQRALDFFKTHPDENAEIRILTTVAKKNPALALQRLQEMVAAGISPPRISSDYSSGGLLQELAKNSPAALEAALDSFPTQLKTRAECLLIGAKMKDAFTDELVKLQDRPDGFKLLTQILREGNDEDAAREAMRDKLLADLANLPESWRASIVRESYGFVSRKSAEKWVTADLEGAGFTPEQANKIRVQAIGNLYSKPEIALKLLPDVDMEDSNRKNLLSNIFGQLQGKPEKIAAMTELLTTEADRQYVLSLSNKQQETAERPKIDTPAAWLAGLAAVDPKNSSTYEYTSTARMWNQAQRAELTRQFNALPEDTKRAIAENTVGNGYSEAGPLDAEVVRYLVANPAATDLPAGSNQTPESRNIQLASRYVAKLAQTDPTSAGDWIATLPAGQPKLWAQKNLNSLWSQYDPQAASQWLKSLPAADRAAMQALKQR